jgi:hypothetical protein
MNNIIVSEKQKEYFLLSLSHDFVFHSFTIKMKNNLFNFVYKRWIMYAVHSFIHFDETNH